MNYLIVIGLVIAAFWYIHKVGIPAVKAEIKAAATRGEAAAERVIAEIRSQTKSLGPGPGPIPSPPPPGSTPAPIPAPGLPPTPK